MKYNRIVLMIIIAAACLTGFCYYFFARQNREVFPLSNPGKPETIFAERNSKTKKVNANIAINSDSVGIDSHPPPLLHSETYNKLPEKQKKLLDGARSRLGDVYDASYYAEGEPPKGRSACVDVVYYAYLNMGVNLRDEMDKDIRANPSLYPAKGDYAINHRRCQNQIVWFKAFTKILTKKTDKKNFMEWQPGDVVFWSLTNDEVADHVGIVSERKTEEGIPVIIHQFPPTCREEDVLNRWTIMGHFRY